jgi:BirA family transcriptional regulator, biotin operon repressor / biotin---[acetyl-CoA-carboxylase] ligase
MPQGMTGRSASDAASTAARSARYDGQTAEELRERLSVPHVEVFESVGSTLDVAHRLAADGAPSGTVVVANEQTAGRGRVGRRWVSEPGAGIWLTLLERGVDPAAAEALALRLGIAAAPVLDDFADSPVRLKWPNDLYVGRAKLGGILLEARWRDGQVDWLAIGLGLNARVPAGVERAAALRAGVSRVAVLAALVPALRAAARERGALSARERIEYAGRDLARGRRCREPMPGLVRGITADGALVIATGARDVAVRTGSLVLEDL